MKKSLFYSSVIESQQATLEAPFVALQENEEKCFERKEKGETFPLENFQEKSLFIFAYVRISSFGGAGQGSSLFQRSLQLI